MKRIYIEIEKYNAMRAEKDAEIDSLELRIIELEAELERIENAN